MDEREFDGAESAVRTTLSRRAALSPLPPDFARQVALALPERARRPTPSVLRPALAASAAVLLVALAALVVLRGSPPPTGSTPSPSPTPTQQAAVMSPSATPSATTTVEPAPPSPTRVPWTPRPPAPTMLPEDVAPPRYITEAEIERAAHVTVGGLLEAYAAGALLEEVFTPAGLPNAVAADPLLEAIWAGERRAFFEFQIVGWTEAGTRYLPDGTPVRISLEVTADIDPGARIVDRSGGIVREIVERQMLQYDVIASWDMLYRRWRIDELRSPALSSAAYGPAGPPPPCPWRREDVPPAEGFDPTPGREWCDGLARQVPRSQLYFAGEAARHCQWQSAALLFMGSQPGQRIETFDNAHNFARDPERIFASQWLAAYETLPELPAGAVDTGLTNGNVRLFYLTETYDREIYAVIGDTIERWPRLREPAGCE